MTLKTSKLPLHRPMHLSLHSSVIGISTPSSNRSGDKFDANIESYRKLLSADGGMVHGLRISGSSALDLCSVACGYLDGKKSSGSVWDVCAAWVILAEAGGMIASGKRDVGIGECMSEPDVCSKDFLMVRAAPSKDEMKKWIDDFWSLMSAA